MKKTILLLAVALMTTLSASEFSKYFKYVAVGNNGLTVANEIDDKTYFVLSYLENSASLNAVGDITALKLEKDISEVNKNSKWYYGVGYVVAVPKSYYFNTIHALRAYGGIDYKFANIANFDTSLYVDIAVDLYFAGATSLLGYPLNFGIRAYL